MKKTRRRKPRGNVPLSCCSILQISWQLHVRYGTFSQKKTRKRGVTWYTAPLWGHSCNNQIMPLMESDARKLRTAGIHNKGQLYDSGDGIMCDSLMPLRQKP
jgi:hypothetical protein